MPVMEREAYNEYQRRYQKERYHRIRNEMVKSLGGKCAQCGSKKELEIDHIDKNKKTMNVQRMTMASAKRRTKELKNCQVLCKKHHDVKTMGEKGIEVAEGTHGTKSAYAHCKCEICREANTEAMREYRAKKKSEMEDDA